MKLHTKTIAVMITTCTQMITPGQLSASEGQREITTCQSVSPGSYIVLGYGVVHNQPAARVLKERWNADGSIEGKRINRDGNKLLEAEYGGRWRQLVSCDVIVQRTNGTRLSQTRDIINGHGYASRALSFTPGTILKKRYWLNTTDYCSEGALQGQWLGEFSGKVLQAGQWHPYEAVGKLDIEGSNFRGSLISSKSGSLENTSMQGNVKLESNCFGSVRWRDQEGRSNEYRILMSMDGQRAILLRTNPGLFSIGVIEKDK